MSNSAHVTSLESLQEWKAALCTFTAEARDALSAVEMEINRALDLVNDQQKHWYAAVRKAEDLVFQAKNDLARRKMMRFNDRPADTTEQEKELKKALAKLEYAQEKHEATKHWLRELPHAIKDYDSPARQLANFLEADMPKADALLQSKLEALDSYLQAIGPATTGPSMARPAEETPPAPASKREE